MARRRGKKGNNRNNQAQDNAKETKKQTMGSDLKPTRCSLCRFAKDPQTHNACYQRSGIRADLEYVDCIPAMIHYSEKRLAALNLI